MHTNAGSDAVCKRNLSYRGRATGDVLDDDGCVRQLKRWLLAGMQIPAGDPKGKDRHMSLPIRELGAQRHPENLDAPP